MININPDVCFYFLNFLNLKDQENLAKTCQLLNRIVNNSTKLINRIKPSDLKIVNVNFFKKFFHLFSVDHLRQFNYQLITRIELNKITANQGALCSKTEAVAKFLHSLQTTSFSAVACKHQLLADWKKTRGQEMPEFILHQLPYQHMWRDDRTEFRFLGALNKKLKGETQAEEIENSIEKVLKRDKEEAIIDFALNIHQNNLKPNSSENTFSYHLCSTLLHLVDDPRMQLTDAKLLEELYTEFWQQYPIEHLNNQRDSRTHLILKNTYMPLQMFKGLCNHIRNSTKQFGQFQTWLLTEEHLQAWNDAFENQTMESLKVVLIYEIAPGTFKKFRQIVLNFPPQTEVEISYRIPCKQTHHETTQLFIAFQNEMALKNPNWNWSMTEG